MNKEFIPIELADEMIKLGFDDFTMFFGDNHKEYLLWQQAFRFFREKYNFRYSIGATNICVYHIPVTNYHTTFMIQDCKTYEEAELECIKSFIEIAKNEKKNN